MMADKKAALPNNAIVGVLEGKLSHHQKGTFKKNKEYYASLIAASPGGLARLELYENEKHSLRLQPSFMLVGSDVVKVERTTLAAKEMRNSFLISTRAQHYTFYVESSLECDRWVRCIQETLVGEVHVPSSYQNEKVVSEINEIYEPAANTCSQTSEYLVMVDEMTRSKMGVDGKVRLIVEDESLAIIAPSGKMIVRWGLKDIRKFFFTPKTFSVEAGRKSSLGDGNFVFLTDKGETIKSTIDIKLRMLKYKREGEKHCKEAKHHLPEAGQYSPSRPAVSAPYWESSGEIYDTIEHVVPPASTRARQSHTDKLHPQQIIPTKLDSPAKPVTPTRMITDYGNIDQAQAEIYSEPQILTDAWKSHACNDSEEMEIYSNLNFSHPEEEESHYWNGGSVRPPVDVKQEKKVETQVEDIYAQVDISKKCRNKNKK